MKKNEPKSAGPALGLNKNPSESDQIRPNPKTEVGTMGFVKCHYFQWVVNTTLAAFCTFRLQARRARSERPTTMDLRRCFSIPQSTSEFGLNQSKSNLKGGFRLKGSEARNHTNRTGFRGIAGYRLKDVADLNLGVGAFRFVREERKTDGRAQGK